MPTSASAVRPSTIGASTAAAGPAYGPSVAARVSVAVGGAVAFRPDDPFERPGAAEAREIPGRRRRAVRYGGVARFAFTFAFLSSSLSASPWRRCAGFQPVAARSRASSVRAGARASIGSCPRFP